MLNKYLFLLPIITVLALERFAYELRSFLLPLSVWQPASIGIIGDSNGGSSTIFVGAAALFMFVSTTTVILLMALFFWIWFKVFYFRLKSTFTQTLFLLASILIAFVLYALFQCLLPPLLLSFLT